MDEFRSTEKEPRSPQSGYHAVELQSIRGIAALVVLIHHCTFYYRYDPRLKFASEAIFNAHAAVVCFFVLSGFVLHLSLARSPLKPTDILAFYVRRGFRIYPGLWLACLFALVYSALFRGMPLPASVDPWFHEERRNVTFTWFKLATTVTGLATPLLVPIWTLLIELAGSLCMPFIAWVSRRSDWAFGGMLIFLAMLSQAPPLLLGTTHYLVFFALGAAIPKVLPWLRGRGRPLLVGAGGLVLLWFGRLPFDARFLENYTAPFPALLEGIGAMGLIASAYAAPARFRVLRRPWATWLGDISYSLYLVHLAILAIVAGLAEEVFRLPLFSGDRVVATAALLAVTAAASLAVSSLSYRFVELPGLRLGKAVTRQIIRFSSPRTDHRVNSASK